MVEDKPKVEEGQLLCFNNEANTYFVKGKGEPLKDKIRSFVVSELYEKLMQKMFKLKVKVLKLSQEGAKDIFSKQKLTELLDLNWSFNEKDRIQELAKSYLREIEDYLEKITNLKDNAPELHQCINNS